MKSNVFVGLKPTVFGVEDVEEELREHVDYVLAPLTNGRYRKRVGQCSRDPDRRPIPEPLLQDLGIPPFNNSNPKEYIGLLASWLDLETDDPNTREMSLEVLLKECKYARFVGVRNLIVAPPRNVLAIQRYAQAISDLLQDPVVTEHPQLNLSISLPLCELSDPLATWELWNTIRKVCNYHDCLTVSLALPKLKTPNHVLNRWLCEPVFCLLLSSSIFVTNQHNYPVLHKYNQDIIYRFQRINGRNMINQNELCVIMHGVEKYEGKINGGKLSFINYINFMLKKGDKAIMQNMSKTEIKLTEKLRDPRILPQLNPHSEELSNEDYVTFEEDTVKYDMYEFAISKAFEDNLQSWQKRPVKILIAGAGRGPLVDRTFKVLKERNFLENVQLIAVEKNPRSFLYLQKRNFDKWQNRVTLVNEDMTKWELRSNNRTIVDLCISELLGSFGCNELSPECLEAVEKYHSHKNTVYIPKSYSSFIAPISSPVFYQKLNQLHARNPHVYEQPWVLHNIPYNILSSKVNEVWTMKHPDEGNKPQTKREIITEFKIKHRGEIHGLIGYFTADLYDDIVLSILPDGTMARLRTSPNNGGGAGGLLMHSTPDKSHNNLQNKYYFKKFDMTKGLFSWSPYVFPIVVPMLVSDDTELSVLLSRRNDTKSVWYEWSMESYMYMVVTSSTSKSKGYQNQHSVITPSTNGKKPAISAANGERKISNSSPLDLQYVNAVEEEFNHSDEGFSTAENGWDSVHDLHQITQERQQPLPLFEIPEEEDNEEEEIHIRVRTGVTQLHNARGYHSKMLL
ncbi:Uncharacterized protein RNJ44_03992 [Nakaseomyces bracarensis]|uniref:Protein arginine N-methyltransferase n=1 Tax=Nakaseomyces bracarensis TaxID=273131 RepID=A0ABR4NTL7_9SACH